MFCHCTAFKRSVYHEELNGAKILLCCQSHNKVAGNGPFSVSWAARLVCTERLSLQAWICPSPGDARARASEWGCMWGWAGWNGWLQSQPGSSRDAQSKGGYCWGLKGTSHSCLAPSQLEVVWATSVMYCNFYPPKGYKKYVFVN